MTGETIGERLLRLRLAKGLSQREVALKCHRVSYAYISRVEHGERRPSVRAIRQMAAVLGVSAAYLEMGRDYAVAWKRREDPTYEVSSFVFPSPGEAAEHGDRTRSRSRRRPRPEFVVVRLP